MQGLVMTDATLPAVPEPETIYAVFVGTVDQAGVKRIVDAFANALMPANRVSAVKLAIQSTGGVVGDGVFLYNFLRALQTDLTVYNLGQVSSIATTAFLGAGKRKASASASFMLHRSSYPPSQPTTAGRAKLMAESLRLEDERTEAILRERLKLTDDQWSVHQIGDLFFSANDAKAAGIIDEIADFAPPLGQPVFSI